MRIAIFIIFAAYLIVGGVSISLFFGTIYYIAYKNKNINAYFYFWEYASKKEMRLLKLGAIGTGIAILLFILLAIVRPPT
jgi:hypothetical protein